MRALLPVLAMFTVGAVAPPTQPPAQSGCAALLRDAHRDTRLPPPCRSLGRLRLGESAAAVRSLLGQPDVERIGAGGARFAAWIYPRTLNRTLAQRPVPPTQLSYGVLYITSRGGMIAAVRDDTSGHASSLGFAGLRIGDPVTRADVLLGQPSTISPARDYRSYDPLPLAIHVDEDNQRIDGFEIGDGVADLKGPIARGMTLKTADGRVRRLDLELAG